ncbi:hypothetical protein HDE_08317 [Halotydeus destructor]|nr:hypothetical protein HDE_08317 [Halotydeus destructor]
MKVRHCLGSCLLVALIVATVCEGSRKVRRRHRNQFNTFRRRSLSVQHPGEQEVTGQQYSYGQGSGKGEDGSETGTRTQGAFPQSAIEPTREPRIPMLFAKDPYKLKAISEKYKPDIPEYDDESDEDANSDGTFDDAIEQQLVESAQGDLSQVHFRQTSRDKGDHGALGPGQEQPGRLPVQRPSHLDEGRPDGQEARDSRSRGQSQLRDYESEANLQVDANGNPKSLNRGESGGPGDQGLGLAALESLAKLAAESQDGRPYGASDHNGANQDGDIGLNPALAALDAAIERLQMSAEEMKSPLVPLITFSGPTREVVYESKPRARPVPDPRPGARGDRQDGDHKRLSERQKAYLKSVLANYFKLVKDSSP